MGEIGDGSRLVVARAGAVDVGTVLLILDEASAWLRSRGIEQWPEHFSTDWVRPSIERGETWLAALDGEIAATITLSWADPAWPNGSDAAYVHRLAVRRAFAGLGRVQLDWAASEARSRRRSLLRLDCVKSNEKLRHYYECAGFEPTGEASIHGVTVTLFERPT